MGPTTPHGAGSDSGAGTAYGQLIAEQLAEERARKSSLEQRGGFIITTAGSLATLLFALSAVVRSQEEFALPSTSRILLLAAVGFFFVAAVGGLAANIPVRYREADPTSLRELTEPQYWQGELSPASRATAELRVEVLEHAQSANEFKARAVILGFAAEVMAVGLVALSVTVVLL